MMYHVYILLCKDGSYYTGYTKNLEFRLEQHVLGRGARYTRMHKPKKLVYLEEFATRREAMIRERQIKHLTHDEKLKLASSRVK
jgi:putative endonuclease